MCVSWIHFYFTCIICVINLYTDGAVVSGAIWWVHVCTRGCLKVPLGVMSWRHSSASNPVPF